MKQEKQDRRVKYTVMALKGALVELMQKEHISNISVKSLCELADINRSTFYAHFDDQYDLLQQIEQEVLDKIKKDLESQDFNDNRPISFQVLNRILEYVKANAQLFQALLSEHCDPGIQIEIMKLSNVFPIEMYENADERTKEYLAIFGITGCISILQKWLREGMPESTAQIAELIMQILYHGAASFCEPAKQA